MSNRRFRFNLFKLNSYSSPHKNSSCSFPILSMPACVHLAHHDTSPSRPQPSSCSAIPDSSHSWATSSLSEKPAEKKKKRKACWLLWKCFWNLVSACPLLCCLPDGGHQPLNRITASMAPRALSPLQNVSSTMGEIFAYVATSTSQVWSVMPDTQQMLNGICLIDEHICRLDCAYHSHLDFTLNDIHSTNTLRSLGSFF